MLSEDLPPGSTGSILEPRSQSCDGPLPRPHIVSGHNCNGGCYHMHCHRHRHHYHQGRPYSPNCISLISQSPYPSWGVCGVGLLSPFYRSANRASQVMACPRSHRKCDPLHAMKLAPPAKRCQEHELRGVFGGWGPSWGCHSGMAGSLCWAALPHGEERANLRAAPSKLAASVFSGSGRRPRWSG